MNKIKGQYIFNKGTWDVRYKLEDGDEQHFEQVMLHPNHSKFARENQMDWFIIRDCPNLRNGGTWEPIAIVVTSDKVEEVAEKVKGQEMFKRLNDHAMAALTEAGGIPDPKKDVKPLKKINMSENKPFWNWSKFTDIALILGVVFLAALDKDGWGWLIFILFLRHM